MPIPYQEALLDTAEDSLPAGAELNQQITAAEQAQGYILLLILATSLSYRVTGIQKRELICIREGKASCLPDTFPFSFASSVLVLLALGFFFSLAVQGAREPHQTCLEEQIAGDNALASLLVLLAALIRFMNLIKAERGGCQ